MAHNSYVSGNKTSLEGLLGPASLPAYPVSIIYVSISKLFQSAAASIRRQGEESQRHDWVDARESLDYSRCELSLCSQLEGPTYVCNTLTVKV